MCRTFSVSAAASASVGRACGRSARPALGAAALPGQLQMPGTDPSCTANSANAYAADGRGVAVTSRVLQDYGSGRLSEDVTLTDHVEAVSRRQPAASSRALTPPSIMWPPPPPPPPRHTATAIATGFGTAETMNRSFRRRLGATPGQHPSISANPASPPPPSRSFSWVGLTPVRARGAATPLEYWSRRRLRHAVCPCRRVLFRRAGPLPIGKAEAGRHRGGPHGDGPRRGRLPRYDTERQHPQVRGFQPSSSAAVRFRP
jgi:AraC-like DNA-binding protein